LTFLTRRFIATPAHGSTTCLLNSSGCSRCTTRHALPEMTTALSELLCLAHDLNRGGPPDMASRVTCEEFVTYAERHSINHPPHWAPASLKVALAKMPPPLLLRARQLGTVLGRNSLTISSLEPQRGMRQRRDRNPAPRLYNGNRWPLAGTFSQCSNWTPLATALVAALVGAGIARESMR